MSMSRRARAAVCRSGVISRSRTSKADAPCTTVSLRRALSSSGRIGRMKAMRSTGRSIAKRSRVRASSAMAARNDCSTSSPRVERRPLAPASKRPPPKWSCTRSMWRPTVVCTTRSRFAARTWLPVSTTARKDRRWSRPSDSAFVDPLSVVGHDPTCTARPRRRASHAMHILHMVEREPSAWSHRAMGTKERA